MAYTKFNPGTENDGPKIGQSQKVRHISLPWFLCILPCRRFRFFIMAISKVIILTTTTTTLISIHGLRDAASVRCVCVCVCPRQIIISVREVRNYDDDGKEKKIVIADNCILKISSGICLKGQTVSKLNYIVLVSVLIVCLLLYCGQMRHNSYRRYDTATVYKGEQTQNNLTPRSPKLGIC